MATDELGQVPAATDGHCVGCRRWCHANINTLATRAPDSLHAPAGRRARARVRVRVRARACTRVRAMRLLRNAVTGN
jgi:hypothetical protein